MDWYLNLDAGMLFPVDPYYTEMYYVDFDESFQMYNLNYVNNTDEKQMLEAFETREEALAMLAVIAKKLGAINYEEEEEVIIGWDWDKYIPYNVPDNPPVVVPTYPFYYGPTVICSMKAPDSDLVWYESKGELYPVE